VQTDDADTEAPVIKVHGKNPAEIELGADYADLGAGVSDNDDHNLGIHTFLNGTAVESITLDTSAEGTHTIEYVATDQAGNTATSSRTVIVSEPVDPIELANDNSPPAELPSTGTD
jgi:hypothetical protein